jgi:selenocysteine-specific elongation factor
MTMRRLILGTAGHIDHGKTALVRALTGVDTDRLKEEKERGITVDLGFAELVSPESDLRFGVVDVPGHDGFIKNMLAGATGMDLVLLVVAADEGIMPQTREHLAIVELLGVPRLVVAVAKSDLVEEEWLDLVVEEVREALSGTLYPDAPVVPVSSVTGAGLEDLMAILSAVGSLAEEKEAADLARLPVDRVFTMKGAGTVVTGTLWTGRLRIGDRVRVLPGDQEARVRSLQLHGHEVSDARAGARVAVGLAGGGISHQTLSRGQTLVEGDAWAPSWMLSCHLRVLPDTGWELQQGQRVRVHLGTAEVLARAALLDGDRLGPGDDGWVQLRLEGPLLARARDHLVVRSYSPVTTIAGGRVAEVLPVKRRRLRPGEDSLLESLVDDDPAGGLEAMLAIAGRGGVTVPSLPHLLGHPPGTVGATVERVRAEGRCRAIEDRLFSRVVWEEARAAMTRALATYHQERPLKPGMPLEELRQSLPGGSGPGLAEAILRVLVEDGTVRVDRGLSALAGFSPELSERQEASREYVRQTLMAAGLAVPGPSELAAGAGTSLEEIEEILRLMETQEEVLALDGGLFFHRDAIRAAGANVVNALGGRSALGPADFREVLGVTRKYLLPVLRYLDTMGVTTRIGEERSVAEELPRGWGT